MESCRYHLCFQILLCLNVCLLSFYIHGHCRYFLPLNLFPFCLFLFTLRPGIAYIVNTCSPLTAPLLTVSGTPYVLTLLVCLSTPCLPPYCPCTLKRLIWMCPLHLDTLLKGSSYSLIIGYLGLLGFNYSGTVCEKKNH